MYTTDQFVKLLSDMGFKFKEFKKERENSSIPILYLSISPLIHLRAVLHNGTCSFDIGFVGEHVYLPNFNLWKEFNLYNYLLEVSKLKVVLEAREEIIIDLTTWLHVYKNGYSFKNFIEHAPYADCSYCFLLNQYTTKDTLTANDIVTISTDETSNHAIVNFSFTGRVQRGMQIALEDLVFMNTINEVFDKYIHNIPEISAYRRKQIIDELINTI